MSKIYISKNTNQILVNYLKNLGLELEFISSSGIVDAAISNHPDIFLCKMGVAANCPIYFADRYSLGNNYPYDIAFNAACTGRYFIHNLKYTDNSLLKIAKSMDMILIDVKQGYTKCSVVIVDECSLITYDEGIAESCAKYNDLDVLKISPGFIRLDGYDTGFIGGTSGRVGDEIIFNGNLSEHPDFEAIVSFIEKRNLKCVWFDDYKLTDIGSII